MERPAAFADDDNPWTVRRARSATLRDRYPFASEMLGLYEALISVEERAFLNARAEEPAPADLADYVVRRVMPDVIAATRQAGPSTLAEAVQNFSDADLLVLTNGWLSGAEMPPIDRYLARAAASPVLEAIGRSAHDACRGTFDERHCPNCGGPPQLSYFGISGEALVTAPRFLVCARCATSWTFGRLTCANCGETATSRLAVMSESEQFPYVRIDACESCRHYLLTFDLRKEPRCVPVVDELAALPLDLHAQERGLTKIVPNLMGV